MDLLTRHEDDTVLVSPSGRLDLSTYVELRDGLLKQAAEQPSAIVVELNETFEVGSDTLCSVFATVRLRMTPWSGVRLLLVPTTREHRLMLERTGVARFVRIVQSVTDVRAQLVERCRDEVQLGHDAHAVGIAREFLLRACERWQAGAATVSVVLLGGELVENSIKHTETPPTLRIERFPTYIVLSVRDGAAWGDGKPGRGTALFDRLATNWGRTGTLDGGKLVWAAITY